MKQNAIIILLTAVAVLLLVNLLQNRIPATAHARSSTRAAYALGCTNRTCWTVSPEGGVLNLTASAQMFEQLRAACAGTDWSTKRKKEVECNNLSINLGYAFSLSDNPRMR